MNGTSLIRVCTVLTNVLKWDEKGVEVLGKIKGGSSLPFGWPIYKKTMKYFNYTVRIPLFLSIQAFILMEMCFAASNSIRQRGSGRCRLHRRSSRKCINVRV